MSEFGTAEIMYQVNSLRVCLFNLPRAVFDAIPAKGWQYLADDDHPAGDTVYCKTIRRNGMELWFDTREAPYETREDLATATPAMLQSGMLPEEADGKGNEDEGE